MNNPTNPHGIAQWMLQVHRYVVNSFIVPRPEMLPPGSAPIYTHSLEYIDKYRQYLKTNKMESNTVKMNYYDKVEGCREAMSDDWFGFILTMIMDIVSDSELNKEDTIELMEFLTEEIKK